MDGDRSDFDAFKSYMFFFANAYGRVFCYKDNEFISEAHKKVLEDVDESRPDIAKLSKEELIAIGCKKWDEEGLVLFPLWLATIIPNGTEVTDIEYKTFITDDDTDKDTRFGCVAYGLVRK